MAGKSKFGKLKPLVRAAWEEGKADKAIARETGVPISTVKRWRRSFEDPDPGSDPDEPPTESRFRPRPKPVQKPRGTPPNVVAIEGGRAQVAKFNRVVKVAGSIMDDPNQPGGIRVQAANTMLKAIALSAELPAHILQEVEQHSLTASVEEVEARGDEQIAQDYRELLG